MIAPQSIQDAPYSITAYTEHRRKLRGGGGGLGLQLLLTKIRKCFTNFEISLLYYWFHA